jgi:hypothetical protein
VRAPADIEPTVTPLAPERRDAALDEPLRALTDLLAGPWPTDNATAPPVFLGADVAQASTPGATPSRKAPSGETSDTAAPDAPQPTTSSTGAPAGGASGGGGGISLMFLAVLCAALAAMAQATRALVRPRSTPRSIALVLVVERPG